MFVLITLNTGYVGEEQSMVYEFPPNTKEDDIEAYAYELALDNACMYGHESDEDLEDISSVTKVLDMSREDIIDVYGDIYEA